MKQSAYEIARLERIHRNNQEMVRLGLMDAADAMKSEMAAAASATALANGSSSSSSTFTETTNDKKKNENQNTNKKDDDADDEDETTLSEVVLPFAVIDEQAAALLRSDIRVLLQNQLLINNSQTTPRVLTRIFHGLSSPTFEGKELRSKCSKFYRSQYFGYNLHHNSCNYC